MERIMVALDGSEHGDKALDTNTLIELCIEMAVDASQHIQSKHLTGRIKQWLSYLADSNSDMARIYQNTRTLRDAVATATVPVLLASMVTPIDPPVSAMGREKKSSPVPRWVIFRGSARTVLP